MVEGICRGSSRRSTLKVSSGKCSILVIYAYHVVPARTDRRSMEGRLNRQEILQAFSVLNTADYCAETTSQLEERLKQKIHPEFADRVSLENERELFST